jgi:hypothetical protein
MLRFIRLESEDKKRVDYLDLSNVVYVREVNDPDADGEEGPAVDVHFTGRAVARLRGPAAAAFLRQFRAYVERLNLHSGGPSPSGPGLSALSP